MKNDVNVKIQAKILFWIDVSLIQFGIAKKLQKKIDADFYVIYDLNHHLKKSFIQQKMINFKKEWYFWDDVKGIKEPDVEYLKQIEKKYKINLWEIAYAERNFYKYNAFYRFSRKEILSILEQECRLFEKVIDEVNPNYLIIKTTDFHRNYLLTEMCRIRNVKILMLTTSRLANKASIVAQSDKIDYELDKKTEDKIKNDSFEELREYFKKRSKSQQKNKIHSAGMNYPQYKKILPGVKWLTGTVDKKFGESYDHYGVTRRKAISHYFSYSIKGKMRKKFIDKELCKKIELNKKFIFFPLQVQPERNVDIDAPFYANQIEVVTNIAKALPADCKLFVKEHPLMRYRHWREITEYEEMISLPNVEVIHPEVSAKEILENCLAVITIAGSGGLEAALHKKPAIVFADTIYASLPSVYRLKNLEELPNLIREALDTEVKLTDINKFINILERNSFDFDITGHYTKILEKFHSGGFMISNQISMKELEEFIEEDKKVYELLADEHLKKIEQYANFKN